MAKLLVFVFALVTSVASSAQDVAVIKMPELERILQLKEPEIIVVNFWATWCAPCIKELPYFEGLNSRKESNIKVILISLDFADKIGSVKSFVKRKSIKSEVVLLDEIDYNSWIDSVDPSWEGAIPATLIRNTKTGQRKFIAHELQEGDLETLIEELSKS